MALVVNSNVSSVNAQRNLANSQMGLQKSFERLSSGLRIVRAGDDAGGLGISERMRARTRSLEQANRNTQDGISLVQTAEGGLNETHSMLTRMRELAVQSANGTFSAGDKDNLNTEFTALQNEVTRVANSTEFNGVALNNAASTITLQVGAGTTAGTDTIDVATVDSTAAGLGVDAATLTNGIGGTATAAQINTAITAIDTAIETVSTTRAGLGAAQNRLESSMRNTSVQIENLVAAESRIRDVDVASETAKMTRNQILQQAGVSILAQANQSPQAALSLLR